MYSIVFHWLPRIKLRAVALDATALLYLPLLAYIVIKVTLDQDNGCTLITGTAGQVT